MTGMSAWTLIKSRHRLALCVAIFSASLILVGAVSSGLVQNPSVVAPKSMLAMPVVPIFAVVNQRDDHVVFINESDLGYRVDNLFPLPDDQPLHDRTITTNVNGLISLGQPDAKNVRETSLYDINLSIAGVGQALQQGLDHTRVNNYHEKQVFKLPNGEQAMWIMVPHFRKYLRYSSGLVYVVRDNRPVILYQMSASHEFQLRDFDEDGFLDIGRVMDRSFAWTHWQYHRYDPEAGYYVEAPRQWHWFPLRYTVQEIKVMLALCLPLLVTIALAAWLRRHWLSVTVNVFAQLYLLLAVLSIAVISTLNLFPLLWAITISILLITLMRFARILVRKQVSESPLPGDSEDSTLKS